ncbi:MAG: RpiB/LacA/LacB family sugar-phosphate isomerase [Candidatus Liptonbacteria bacterium]|nr:RpiB/LacA/LacB family sugar-phosphate isomerase [Candidatus Liptonbacteria bacterium]
MLDAIIKKTSSLLGVRVYLGADHRGFKLKEALKKYLVQGGHNAEDLTPDFKDGDDYTDAAGLVAQKVGSDPDNCSGILICGSGAGMDITANKFKRVRSVLGFLPEQVSAARHDDNVNILSLASDFTDEDKAKQIVKTFLETKFGSEERFLRRIEKILKIEKDISGPG